MAKIIDARLRDNVHLLGELLGNTIRAQHGDQFFDKIERIRKALRLRARARQRAHSCWPKRSTVSTRANCCP